MTCSTGSDDFSVVHMNGVPFKYASTSRRHTRFVQSVDVRSFLSHLHHRASLTSPSSQYAPSGSLFASAGSDGQVFLYDGLTAEERGALLDGEAAHKAGVFAASFSKDSKSIATSSADRTTKLWDVESGKVVQ